MSISRLSSRLIQQNTRGTIQLRSMSSLTVPHINGLPTAHHPGRTGKQDKLLFTPGPLTTSYTTKAAAVRDLGSRDQAFINIVREVRSKLLQVANVDDCMFTSIPIQGSGTYAVEATLSSAIPKDQGVLIIANGAYGMRMATIAKAHNIRHTVLEFPDDTQPDLKRIEAALLTSAKHHSHVAVVHSETTSGIINNIEAIGQLVFQYKKHYIVDAMSSFGAVPIDFEKAQIDYLVSSANKCIEGIPGFSFIIARHNVLALTKGMADTLALDIYAQCIGLDKDGQFRFTPPTHSLLAFHQALKELEQEGGVKKRAQRYRDNQRILMAGMSKLGFELYLPSANQGYIISSYRYPKDSNWNFNTFYNKLNDLDFVIYPGKVSNADCFRIGHIGRLFPEDTRELLVAIERVCREMKTAAFATKSSL